MRVEGGREGGRKGPEKGGAGDRQREGASAALTAHFGPPSISISLGPQNEPAKEAA